MNAFRSAVVCLFLSLAGFALGANYDEVRQLIAQGEYGKAIMQTDALLTNTQTPLSDHYELLMLKGEAALRAGQRQLAVPAFRAATRMAVSKPQAIAAAANAILAQHSVNGQLRVRDAKIDIIKPEDRAIAMQKLADDMYANRATQIEEAITARKLDPIIDVLPDVYRMYVLETQASNGQSHNAENLARKVGTQAHDLILEELQRLQRNINSVEQSAYAIEDWSGWMTRNLTVPQRRELRNQQDYIARIRDAVLEIRRLVTTLRVNPEPWDRLNADCTDLQDQISMVMSRNY